MKCKNCGGNYKTRELECPYCNTENALGKIWMVKRSEAELAYEREKAELGKFLVSPYMLNRILNRALVILGLLYAVIFLGAYLVCLIEPQLENWHFKANEEKITARMEAYYVAGEFEKLYEYMEEECVDFKEFYTYTQAALLNNEYNRYLEQRMHYEALSDEEKETDTYYLESAINSSKKVYSLDMGIYDETDERNRELYESYRKEILAWWISEPKITKDAIDEWREQE